ncbi:AAA family ATPase [Halodesulfovibrio aestuarii]|uniref:AAA family ATPase n=1 Tax=Halodesulfovibrio aestuarii TaxID=126333 RepID=UPI0004276010
MQAHPQETAQINPFGEQFRTFQFYPSESHKKVVHRITRGLECNCGLILLTGEIGIGKTSVCRHIMQSSGDEYIFAESGNPFFKPAELLYNFCKQYGIDTTGRNSINDLTEGLHDFFMQQAEAEKKPVIVIDESHLLTDEHFSLLLALYNMRLGAIPLVQIILIGQVEIMDRLRQPGLEALNQRIGVRCELFPMDKQETENYVQFKLANADFPDLTVFEDSALARVWLVTGGLPRLINHISSHALDSITFSGVSKISPALIEKVASDPMYQGLFSIRTKKKQLKYKVIAACILTAILIGGAIYTLGLPQLSRNDAEQAPTIENSLQKQSISPSDSQLKAINSAPAEHSPEPANINKNRRATAPDVEPTHAPVPETITTPPIAKKLLIPTKNDAVSITVYDSPQEEPVLAMANEADTKIEDNTVDAQPLEHAQNARSEKHAIRDSNSPPDKASHPALEALQIDALAWSEQASTRMVVIGDQVLHEGDQVGSFILKAIKRDHLIFSLNGIEYKKKVRL